jgi:NTP pyrophosphatase (non-canonical NTP hydrolase)
MDACFGAAIKADVQERCDRFIEEALEFVQAAGYSAERAHALVDYTFGRPLGEINQEVGGVMVTLAAMCNTLGVDIGSAAETELARVWTKIDKIRAKQAAKPTGSALPIAIATEARRAETGNTGSVHEGAGPKDIAQ